MIPLMFSYLFVGSLTAVILPYVQVMLSNHGFSPSVIGLFLSLYESIGIVGPFVIGSLSDRTGKPREVSIAITIVMVLATIPVALSSHPVMIAIFLSLSSFFWRSVYPVQDAMTIKRLGANASRYTYIRSLLTAGFIIFSLLHKATGWLDTSDNRSILMWIVAGGALYLVAIFLVPKDRNITEADRSPSLWPFGKSKGDAPVFTKTLTVAIIVIAFNRLAMSSINSFNSLYVKDVLERADLVGVLNSIGAVCELLFMLLSGYLLGRKVKPMTLIALSALGLIVRLLLYAFVPTMFGAVLAQTLHSLTFGIFHPAAVMFIGTHVAKNRRAMGMALYTSLGVGLPAVIGSALGGVLVESLGFSGMFVIYTAFAAISLVIQWIFRGPLFSEKISQ